MKKWFWKVVVLMLVNKYINLIAESRMKNEDCLLKTSHVKVFQIFRIKLQCSKDWDKAVNMQ